MTEFEKLTYEFFECIDLYKSGAYISQEKLIELQRTLSCNYALITKENIDAFDKWNNVVYTRPDNESVNAAQTRANDKIPELRQSRKILEAGKSVLIAIQNELKHND